MLSDGDRKALKSELTMSSAMTPLATISAHPPVPPSLPLPPLGAQGSVGAEVGPQQGDVVKMHAAVRQRREIQRLVRCLADYVH